MPIDITEGLFEYAQWSGLRNVVPEDGLELDDLTAAVNIDLDDGKRALRRKGHAQALRSGVFTSIWANTHAMVAIKDGTTLVRLLPDYAVLRSGLTPGLDMSYTAVAGRVFYSNNIENGVIQGGASRTWGMEIPGVPVATAL